MAIALKNVSQFEFPPRRLRASGRPRGKQPDYSSDVGQETHQAHSTLLGFAQSAAHMDIYQLQVAGYVAWGHGRQAGQARR